MKKIIFILLLLPFFLAQVHAVLMVDDFQGYSTTSELSNTWTPSPGGGASGSIVLSNIPFTYSSINKSMGIYYNIPSGWVTVNRLYPSAVDISSFTNIHLYLKGNASFSNSTDDPMNFEIVDDGNNRAQLRDNKVFYLSTNWQFYRFSLNTDLTNLDGIAPDFTKVSMVKVKPSWGRGAYFVDDIYFGDITNQVIAVDLFNLYSSTTALTDIWKQEEGGGDVITGIELADSAFEGKGLKINFDTSGSPWYGKVKREISNMISDWSLFKYLQFNYKSDNNDGFQILLKDTAGNFWESDVIPQNTLGNWQEAVVDITASFSSIDERNIKYLMVTVKGVSHYSSGTLYLDYFRLLKNLPGKNYSSHSEQVNEDLNPAIVKSVSLQSKELRAGENKIILKYESAHNADLEIKLFTLDNRLLWEELYMVNGSGCVEKDLELAHLRSGLLILYIRFYNNSAEYTRKFVINVQK